jgi:integrase
MRRRVGLATVICCLPPRPSPVADRAAVARSCRSWHHGSHRDWPPIWWQDRKLVFCTRTGGPLAAGNVRRAFRAITKKAKLGEDWTPRELRHSFVSLMSDNGVPIETIADLVGHASTSVTEKVYRHQLKPVITQGAETMNTIFGESKSVQSV